MAGIDEVAVERVHLGWVVADERERDPVVAGWSRPAWIEAVDDLDRVEDQPKPAGQFRFDVALSLGAIGERETEPAVEGDRGRHVLHDEPHDIETRCHRNSLAAPPPEPDRDCRTICP